MDKKWILILIMIIVGCSCMYSIASSSTTVGSAIAVVNKSIVTLPDDFSVEDDEKNAVNLINKNTHEKIQIEDMGKKNIAKDCFKDNLNKFQSNSNIKIIKNNTMNIKNITTYQIDYENFTDDGNTSEVYAFTCNHTFIVKLKNYTNENESNKDLTYIISNIKPDYKQSQD